MSLPENLQAEQAVQLAWNEMDRYMQTYVESRMRGMPPYPAARMAGYQNPGSKSKELEMDPRVTQYMRAQNIAKLHEQEITRQDVLNGLMDATRMATTATELVTAWREIGRLVGAYEPTKHEVTITDQRQLQEMSDEQLQKLAAIDADFEVIEPGGSDDSSRREGPDPHTE